jgi:hypothetical protein
MKFDFPVSAPVDEIVQPGFCIVGDEGGVERNGIRILKRNQKG